VTIRLGDSKHVNVNKASTKIVPASEQYEKELGYHRYLEREIADSSLATVHKMHDPSRRILVAGARNPMNEAKLSIPVSVTMSYGVLH